MSLDCYCDFTLPGDNLPLTATNCLVLNLPTCTTSFIDTTFNECNQEVVQGLLDEQIQMFGINVNYIVYNYSLTGHNYLYGEHTTARFATPNLLKAMVKFENDTIAISQYGFTVDAQIQVIFTFQQFYDIFGDGAEPKSGDLIEIYEAGLNRPGNRKPMLFQITKKTDEGYASNGVNPLLTHTVWVLTCKRYEYSAEGNMEPKPVNNQVGDGKDFGRMTFTSEDAEQPSNTADPEKVYEDNVADEADKNFNYDDFGVDTDVYGGY